MKLAMQQLGRLFEEIEVKHHLKPGTLLEIYKAEGRVVFLGKRRNIIPDLRRIALNALEEKTANES
jgi:hypothetical protein